MGQVGGPKTHVLEKHLSDFSVSVWTTFESGSLTESLLVTFDVTTVLSGTKIKVGSDYSEFSL